MFFFRTLYFLLTGGVLFMSGNTVMSTKMDIASVSYIHNKIVNTNILGEFFGVPIASICFDICSQDDYCLTFFHHTVEKFCQTHSIVFTINSSWEDRPGTVYYHRIHPGKCYSLDYIYHPGLKFCYKIDANERLDWEGARKYCQREGGDLIVFDTMDKYNHINQTLHANTYLNTNKYNMCLAVGGKKVGPDWYWIDKSKIPPSSPLWYSGDSSTPNNENVANLCSLYSHHMKTKRSRRLGRVICGT